MLFNSMPDQKLSDFSRLEGAGWIVNHDGCGDNASGGRQSKERGSKEVIGSLQELEADK